LLQPKRWVRRWNGPLHPQTNTRRQQTPKFKHGQVVYIKASAVGPRDGPYKIERVISKAKFTLCDISTSMTAKDGKEFDADELET